MPRVAFPGLTSQKAYADSKETRRWMVAYLVTPHQHIRVVRITMPEISIQGITLMTCNTSTSPQRSSLEIRTKLTPIQLLPLLQMHYLRCHCYSDQSLSSSLIWFILNVFWYFDILMDWWRRCRSFTKEASPGKIPSTTCTQKVMLALRDSWGTRLTTRCSCILKYDTIVLCVALFWC